MIEKRINKTHEAIHNKDLEFLKYERSIETDPRRKAYLTRHINKIEKENK